MNDALLAALEGLVGGVAGAAVALLVYRWGSRRSGPYRPPIPPQVVTLIMEDKAEIPADLRYAGARHLWRVGRPDGETRMVIGLVANGLPSDVDIVPDAERLGAPPGHRYEQECPHD